MFPVPRMSRTCPQCSSAFEVTKEDLAFFEQVSPVFGGKKEVIPAPVLCPACRMQRRLLFRNDLCLYHRKSDLTGKAMISIYAQDKPYKVYDQDEWWSDRWDALSYGRDFDFSRTFSEQFRELTLAVPHQGLFTTNAENSYYTNHSLNTRNCYLIAGGPTWRIVSLAGSSSADTTWWTGFPSLGVNGVTKEWLPSTVTSVCSSATAGIAPVAWL